ncbi:serine-rich adhesin for platelets isoform X2 [Venturia canescens]|uniref:serine-rich adhesin for platelets isoform X2 n=1 Tax=Venturia canescens TaxID=32260 RepID=UPI001C9BF39A|nr:serine-rich adhesin for platelets isoform X2 [Venturia canescens]
MSREFYVPCAQYAYPCGSGSTDGVVVSNEVVGMDCMPLRPGPFHYLISEQAKSLVALQELQNEVGALLEFRDLVIETFPNLRHKMATSSSSSSSAVVSVMSQSQGSSHIPLPLSSPSSRRISEWEPGKVRRRVAQPVREGESSGSSLPRSRSNSHSGGSKNSATVQDSGFSTETSSKDSASTAIARPTSPRPVLDEAEDELWNLLDVIHRKGIRLREEVESLQGRLESVGPDELRISGDVLEAVRNVTRTEEDLGREDSAEEGSNDLVNARLTDKAKRLGDGADSSREDGSKLTVLRREKEQLLDKVAELEAETLSSRARAQELQTELAALSALRNGLEDRLRSVLETRNEIVTPGAQRKQTSAGQNSPGNISSPKHCGVHLRGNKQSAFTTILTPSNKPHKNRFRTRTIDKSVLANGAVLQPVEVDADPEAAAHERRIRLGALDSVLVSPTRVAHVADVDGVKIAAILRERSPLELQRHLITTTVHNQCLQKRLDEVEKSTGTLSERLDKAREENDDLRFQLEERNIELEGTKARVRVLERLQQRPPTETEPDLESETEPRGGELCCPEAGSSTESARDHHHSAEVKPSPRRRPPSRIPLLGSGTKPAAPKPPSSTSRNDSRESLKSLKSLNSRPPRDSSRESNAGTTKSSLSRGTARDSSRESLNRQSITTSKTSGKEASRESLNRSLSRNNNTNRDSINKITTTTTTTSPTITTATAPTTTSSTTSLSRARDSLESNNTCNNNNISLYPPGTPPRRPPAPARRSQSLARPSVDNDSGKGFTTDPPSSWCSSSSSFRHSESSLYPDSLNQESTSATGSTRVEFILGSPTRHFRPTSAWPSRYFDSINSTAMVAESLMTDEFPLRRGEALADCDSLECHPISSEG